MNRDEISRKLEEAYASLFKAIAQIMDIRHEQEHGGMETDCLIAHLAIEAKAGLHQAILVCRPEQRGSIISKEQLRDLTGQKSWFSYLKFRRMDGPCVSWYLFTGSDEEVVTERVSS